VNSNKIFSDIDSYSDENAKGHINNTKNRPSGNENFEKVKITQINVDDEDRIKEDFMNKILDEKNCNNKNKDQFESKSKVELSKEYSKTFGKGFSMLKKIGFQVGKGLGVKEQGIIQPIEIKKRERNKGISHEDNEKGIIDEDLSYSENEFNAELHKNKKLHKLKSKKDNTKKLKKEQKWKEDKIKEMDEFEKLVDNWDKLKTVFEKFKNKKIDFNKNENIDNDIDLLLENDINVDVSKFLLEKTSENGDFILFNKKIKQTFNDKYNLKLFKKNNLKRKSFKDENNAEILDDIDENKSKNSFSIMVKN